VVSQRAKPFGFCPVREVARACSSDEPANKLDFVCADCVLPAVLELEMTLGLSRHDTVIPVSGSQPDCIPPRAALGQNGRSREGSATGTW